VSAVIATLRTPGQTGSAAAIATSVASLFGWVCGSTLAESLVGEWGLQNTSFQTFSVNGTGVQFANFSIQWATWSNGTEFSDEAYWADSISNGTINGPILASWPAGLDYGATGTQNSSAWEFWGSSTPTSLYDASAYTKVVSMTSEVSEQNDPPSVVADSAAAVWVGMSPDKAGYGGLLQTGYAYDASNPSANWCVGFTNSCDYGLWWEYYPTYAAQPYTGDPTIHANDVVREEAMMVNQPDSYETDIFDTTMVPAKEWTSTVLNLGGYSPKYAQFTIETATEPSGGKFWYTPQVPGFSDNPINFEEGMVCTGYGCNVGAGLVWLSSAYSNGWYDQYQMEQSSGSSANTNQNWVSGTQYSGGSGSWPQISWANSYYYYCGLSPQDSENNSKCNTNGGGGGGGSGGGGGGCGTNCGGCVNVGTPILTPSGYVSVQDLQPGAAVLEYNFSTSSLVQGRLLFAN
jgi:hypothetical protein